MQKKPYFLGSITALTFLLWLFGSRISKIYLNFPSSLGLSIFFILSFLLLLQQRNQKAALAVIFIFAPLLFISALPISDFYTLRQTILFNFLSMSAFVLGVLGGGVFLRNKIMQLLLVFGVLCVAVAIVGLLNFNVTRVDGGAYLIYKTPIFEIKQVVALSKKIPGFASITGNPNTYGLVSFLFIFLSLISYYKNQITKKLASWVIAVGIIGLVLSFSRAAMLAAFASLTVALVFNRILRHMRTSISFSLFAATTTLALSIFSLTIFLFISASISYLDVSSYANRVGRWKDVIDALNFTIIIGEGRGSVVEAVGISPHSGYLAALFELGLLGILWLYFFTLITMVSLLSVGKKLEYTERRYSCYCVGLLFFVLVRSIFENGILATLPVWAIFCFAAGAIWNQVLSKSSVILPSNSGHSIKSSAPKNTQVSDYVT